MAQLTLGDKRLLLALFLVSFGFLYLQTFVLPVVPRVATGDGADLFV
jgi:hypothetical protein